VKSIILLIFLIFFFSQLAKSAEIEVSVPSNLQGNISSISFNPSPDLVRFQIEFYNVGSVAYKARIRLDTNDSQNVFTGWSDEKSLMPGDRNSYDIYWYTNSTGNFSAKAKVYFANEIFEQKFNVEKKTSSFSENVFEITNFRTYDNFIVFDLKSNQDAKNVVVIPTNMPIGWIFEQKKIDSLNRGATKNIVIQYYPSVWTLKNVTLMIASDEGRYYSEKTFELSKETGILWFFHYFIDRLKMLSSQLGNF
jgi:hypothetical protein